MKKLGTREAYNKPSFNLEEVVVEGGFTLTGVGGGVSTEDVGDLEEFDFGN